MRKSVAVIAALGFFSPFVSLTSAQATKPAAAVPVSAGAALAHKVPEMKVAGVPFEQAIDFLRNVSGLNINVDWHALEQLNVTRQTPINLRLSDVPLRRVIKAVLDETGAGASLTFYVEDGIVEITSKEIADKQLITEVYSVDDLIMVVPDFVGPGMNLQNQGNQTSGQGGGGSGGGQSLFSGSSGSGQQDTQLSKQQRADNLVKMIKDTVHPEVWRDNGGTASIGYFNGHLIVTAPRSVHEALGH